MDTVFITSLAAALSFLVGCFVTWLLCARRTHTQTVRALTAEATLAARDGQQDTERQQHIHCLKHLSQRSQPRGQHQSN